MTRWRAVAVGVTVAVLTESVGYVLTGRLSLFGGAFGGLVAGWVMSSESDDDGRSGAGRAATVNRGAGVGLAVGVAWGVVLAPVAVYLSLATGEVALSPYEHVVRTVGLGMLAALLAFGLTVPPLVSGVLGATFRTVYTATKTNRRHG
ncbi:hypothetical protein SAMN04487949_2048 [Halogranum gelatinilyticum]|uniref:Uncharacterized protein n=1 Tax=Halogranum gelatinilyticum TaxID=660521 RepID=A0A1G9U5T0_9EURY|nr:hypothetical protein [Halogranum gelatinilyticum]SDM55163.1 hypothetical protein SAMN04487949_2048 [Halogranum gelatinilyticum]